MATKIAFLLGAGISIPAGFPSTSEITSRILLGEGVIRHTDGTYYFAENNPDGSHALDISVRRAALLLNRLLLEINRYYLFEIIPHTANYEDLYYVANQILDSEAGEFENPIIGAFLDNLSADITRIGYQYSMQTREAWDLDRLFNETENYIRDMVWRMLQRDVTQNDYLKNICDSCLDDEVESVDIFSLNHDTLLESYFDKAGITYNEGFGRPIEGVRYWHPSILENSDTKVRLLKLHGSISWFSFPRNEHSFGSSAIGIPSDWDIWHTVNPTGERQHPEGGRPVFLAGTFNKMLQYTREIFADLHFLFRRSLRTIDRLIICGYGFGDKGINSQIVEWMSQSMNKHLTIIHQEPKRLKRNARGAIKRNWDDWSNEGRLSCVEAYIENTTWQEIKGNSKLKNRNGS